MAARYFRVDVDFFHKATCHKLLNALGPWGPLVFLSLIARAKDGIEPGVFSYSSDAVAWDKLGFDATDVPFTLEAFLKLTGRMKQTSKTRVGRTMNVKITRYGDWQKDAKRYEEAVRKSSKRGHSTADTDRTQGGTRSGRRGGPSSTSITTPLPPISLNGKSHELACPVCGSVQRNRSELDDHLEYVHPDKPAVPTPASDDLPF